MKTNHDFIINGVAHKWAHQTITITDIRKIGNISNEDEVYLKVQGKDEFITEKNPVDLSRFGIEQIYSKKAEKFKFILNGKLFISDQPFVNSKKLRELGEIHEHDEIYLRVEGKDQNIGKDQNVDLAPFGIEEFYSVKKGEEKLVHITVDNQDRKIKPGIHSVADIKQVGMVDPSYDLDQVIDEELRPLPDTGKVEIKGCEVFLSHPKDGRSS